MVDVLPNLGLIGGCAKASLHVRVVQPLEGPIHSLQRVDNIESTVDDRLACVSAVALHPLCWTGRIRLLYWSENSASSNPQELTSFTLDRRRLDNRWMLTLRLYDQPRNLCVSKEFANTFVDMCRQDLVRLQVLVEPLARGGSGEATRGGRGDEDKNEEEDGDRQKNVRQRSRRGGRKRRRT